jgi:hypothetical protein
LNRETNYRTEVVVVLNNQPQGGLAMRRRPDGVYEGRRNGWGDDGLGSNRSYFQQQQGWSGYSSY